MSAKDRRKLSRKKRMKIWAKKVKKITKILDSLKLDKK